MLIGFLSDAHGNIQGFLKGLEILKAEGADDIYFLGDAVGYIPRIEVVRELRSIDIQCVMGNHEAMLLKGKVDVDKDSIYQLSVIEKLLSKDEKAYLNDWPESISLTYDDHDLLLIHGSPSEPTFGYVYPDTDLGQFSSLAEEVIFMGNTHHAFSRTYRNKLFINIGSCGLPRDSEGTGCVCLYDSMANKARLIRYDISDSARILLADPSIHSTVKRHLQRSVEVSSND